MFCSPTTRCSTTCCCVPRTGSSGRATQPTTLRYVVVDELHTFDGAQGTDLALLLRRLRARLQVPEGHLLCVGTSATLGATADTAPLREYARQVFAAPFAESAVIVEDRLSAAEFLGDTTIEHVLQPRADFGEVLDPTRYLRQEDAVSAWFKVFFPELPAPSDVTDGAWRVSLGERLKRHLLFVNLLKLMKGGVVDYADLLRQMQGPLPADARSYVRQVLDALLVLVAWARSGDGAPPFVTLRLQVWIRELRRMVAKVASAPESVDMRADADLAAAPGGLYLPLVQCSECHTTGWLSRLAPGSSKVSTKRDEIYSTWFARRPEAVRLYPGRRLPLREVDGRDQHLCAACGNLQELGEKCDACAHTELVRGVSNDGHADEHARQRGLLMARHHVSDVWRARPPAARRRSECDPRFAGGRAELGQRVQRR